jgi:vacuolar-type H+-ATPase catalytic subunit A/Vma1
MSDREEEVHNILELLVFPTAQPTRQRRKQQPLINYTKSQILIFEEYMNGMDQLVAARERAEAEREKKKKNTQSQKEQRAQEKAQKYFEKAQHASERQAKKTACKRAATQKAFERS